MTVSFDMGEVEKICRLHPTDKDLAAYFGVSTKTIQRKKKNKEFLRAYENGHGNANLSLRRKQMEIALSGNVSMLIWLGKQCLSQHEQVSKSQQELANQSIADKQLSQFERLVKLRDSGLFTDEQLQKMADLVNE